MSFHADPTFWGVARRESRDCTTCIYYSMLWGLGYCNKEKWKGIKYMKRCLEYKREIK